MLDNVALARQVRANLVKQFADSGDFDETVPDNQDGNTKVADRFWSNASCHPVLIVVFAKASPEVTEVDVA